MVYTRSCEFKIRGIVVEARYSGKSEQVQSRGQQGGASQLPKAQLEGARVSQLVEGSRVSQLVEGSRVSQLVPKHNWKVPAGCSNLYLGRCLSKPDKKMHFCCTGCPKLYQTKLARQTRGNQPQNMRSQPQKLLLLLLLESELV